MVRVKGVWCVEGRERGKDRRLKGERKEGRKRELRNYGSRRRGEMGYLKRIRKY